MPMVDLALRHAPTAASAAELSVWLPPDRYLSPRAMLRRHLTLASGDATAGIPSLRLGPFIGALRRLPPAPGGERLSPAFPLPGACLVRLPRAEDAADLHLDVEDAARAQRLVVFDRDTCETLWPVRLDELSVLERALACLAQQGKGGLLLECGWEARAYVQLYLEDGSAPSLELPGNDYLPPALALSRGRVAGLRLLGWRLPDGTTGHFTRAVRLGDADGRAEAARAMATALREAFGLPGETAAYLCLDDPRGT